MIQLSKRVIFLAISILVASLPAASVASPMLSLSDNAAVYFVGSASITSDSNIGYASENKIDDLIIEVRPGFEFVSGNPETGADFSLSASYGLRRYTDYDEYNSELPSIVAQANFVTAKSNTSVTASYIESQAENRRYNVPGLVLKTAISSAGINTDYKPTAKSSIVAGLSYDDTDHENVGTDYSAITVPVNLYYAASEKLDAGVGYRYRNTSLDSAVFGDRTSHFLNVGLKGELTPKMVADVKVGFQTTDLDVGDSVDGLALDAKLTFIADQKTSADLMLSKDIVVGFGGEVIDNLSVALSGNYQFTQAFTGNAMVLFGNDSFKNSPREDDFTVIQIGASYTPVYYMSIEAAYMIMENESNNGVLDFTKNTLKLLVNLRY